MTFRPRVRRPRGKGAVSEVIANVILVGMVVMLFSIVFYYVATIPVPQETQRISFETTLESSNEFQFGSRVYLNVTHTGGRAVTVDSTMLTVSVDGSPGVMFTLPDGSISDGVWTLGETWRLDTTNTAGSSRFQAVITPSSMVSVSVVDISSSTVVWAGDVYPRVNILGPVIVGGTDPSPVPPGSAFRLWARVVEVEGQGVSSVAFTSTDLGYPTRTDMTYNMVKDRWEFPVNTTMPGGRYSFTVYANDTMGKSSSRSIYFIVGQVTSTGPDLEISDQYILFTDDAPIHGDTITISAVVFNIGGSATGANVTFYLDDYNTSLAIIGWYNITSVPSGGGHEASITWRATPGGVHTIWVMAEVYPDPNADADLTNNIDLKRITVLPRVLLVDDDQEADSSAFSTVNHMKAALEATDYTYDLYVNGGGTGPDYDSGNTMLRDYDVVVWMTGRSTVNTLTWDQPATGEDDVGHLTQFLDAGGRLWLLGEGIMDEAVSQSRLGNFIQSYFGASSVSLGFGLPSQLNSSGTPLWNSKLISFPTYAYWPDASDRITSVDPTGNAVLVDPVDPSRIFATNYSGKVSIFEYRTVLFPFPFPFLRDTGDQAQVTYFVMLWLSGMGTRLGRDLSISFMSITPSAPRFMQDVQIKLTVRNNGDQDETGAEVLITDTFEGVETTLTQVVVPLVTAYGGESTVMHTWVPDRIGQHRIRAIVDWNNMIPETNEQNNEISSFIESGEVFVGYSILLVDDDGREGSTAGTSNYNSTRALIEDIEYMNDVHTDGLVLSMRMEPRIPNEALDSSGYLHHGTPNGGGSFTPSGKFGYALELDGVNDYVRVEDAPELNPGSALTLETWVKTTDTTGRLIDKWTTAGTSWTEAYLLNLGGGAGAGKIRFAVRTSLGKLIVDSASAVNDGTWHHVAATDDGQMLSIYIDGSLDAQLDAGPHTIRNGTHPVVIGWSGTSQAGQYLAGSVDNLRIYGRALTPSEVGRRYTHDPGRDPFEYDYVSLVAGQQGPDISTLNRYNTVIWDAGIASNAVLTTGDRDNITMYLHRGTPPATFYLIAPNIILDINSAPDKAAYINFMCENFGADMSGVVQVTRTTFYGTFNDSVTHGMKLDASPSLGSGLAAYLPRRAPACTMPGTDTYTVLHADANDDYWTSTSASSFGFRHSDPAFRFKTGFIMVDPAYMLGGLDRITPRGELTYMFLHWFGAPDPRPNPRVTPPDIYVGKGYGTPLAGTPLEISGGYLLKARVRNLGTNDVSGLSLRFMDGSTVIGTDSSSVGGTSISADGWDVSDGMTVVETLWSPLFAGVENISVLLDPLYTLEERTRVDDFAYQRGLVYFFYDDLESGGGKWMHEAVLARINGETPLDIIPAGVKARTDIAGDWDAAMSSGWVKTAATYHSQNTSFYLKELPPAPLDIFLVLDNGPPMNQNYGGSTAWEYVENASKTFIGMLRPQDRIGIISFKKPSSPACGGPEPSGGFRVPCIARPLTFTTTSGKNLLNATVDAMVGTKGQTPMYDGTWLAARELIVNNAWYSNRTQAVVALSASASQGDTLDPPDGACCGSSAESYRWNGLSANSGLEFLPVPVFGVWAGSGNNPGFYHVADTSDGGAFFRASTIGDIQNIFVQIALILLGGIQTLEPVDATPLSGGVMPHMVRPEHRWLVTPEISLAGYRHARLSFWQRYKMVPGQNGGLVQIGLDKNDCSWHNTCPLPLDDTREPDGVHWEYVRPVTPYNSNLNISRVVDSSNATYTDPYYLKDEDGNEMLFAWSGTSTKGTFGWEYVEVDLDPYVGHAIRVNLSMFQFNPGTDLGWFIDDVVLKVSRGEGDPVAGVRDQWSFVCGTLAGRSTCAWRNQDTGSTNVLRGGLDNSLVSAPIDLTKAKRAYILFDTMYNVNSQAGLPPDSLRVEVSSDGGVNWKPVNLGIRLDAGISGGGGTPAWTSSNNLNRFETNISGWVGSVIRIRFRVVTTTESGYAHTDASTSCSPAVTPWCGGVWVDNIRVFGESVRKGIPPEERRDGHQSVHTPPDIPSDGKCMPDIHSRIEGPDEDPMPSPVTDMDTVLIRCPVSVRAACR